MGREDGERSTDTKPRKRRYDTAFDRKDQDSASNTDLVDGKGRRIANPQWFINSLLLALNKQRKLNNNPHGLLATKQKLIDKKEEYIRRQQDHINGQNRCLDGQQKRNDDQKKYISQLEEENKLLSKDLQEAEKLLDDRTEHKSGDDKMLQIIKKQKCINAANKRNGDQQHIIEDQSVVIDNLQEKLDRRDKRIEDKDNFIDENNQYIRRLKKDIGVLKEELDLLRGNEESLDHDEPRRKIQKRDERDIDSLKEDLDLLRGNEESLECDKVQILAMEVKIEAQRNAIVLYKKKLRLVWSALKEFDNSDMYCRRMDDIERKMYYGIMDDIEMDDIERKRDLVEECQYKNEVWKKKVELCNALQNELQKLRLMLKKYCWEKEQQKPPQVVVHHIFERKFPVHHIFERKVPVPPTQLDVAKAVQAEIANMSVKQLAQLLAEKSNERIVVAGQAYYSQQQGACSNTPPIVDYNSPPQYFTNGAVVCNQIPQSKLQGVKPAIEAIGCPKTKTPDSGLGSSIPG